MFMPWVFLLFASLGGRIAGYKGYLLAASLVIAFYL
jgi:hypothetical protein